MIRALTCCACCCVFLGCQTPPGIRNESALTQKLATQINTTVSTYVTALNSNNSSDTTRLSAEVADTTRIKAANADQATLWALAQGTRASSVNRLLTEVSALSASDANPISGSAQGNTGAISDAPALITFDDSPLKVISTVAGDITTPRALADQISVISSFATTVRTDLNNSKVSSAN